MVPIPVEIAQVQFPACFVVPIVVPTPVEISQVQFLDKTADVPIAVQHQVPMDRKVRVDDASQLQFIDQILMNMHMNEEGRLSLVEIGRIVQVAPRCRDEEKKELERQRAEEARRREEEQTEVNGDSAAKNFSSA